MPSKRAAWYIWLSLALLIKLFSLFPAAVEQYYSNGLYPFISGAQRLLWGWIPLSVGDLLYSAAIIGLGLGLTRLAVRLFRRQFTRKMAILLFRNIFFYGVVIYVVFNLLWGLNYNRLGIGKQMGLETARPNRDDLVQLMTTLAGKLNDLDSQARVNRAALANKRHLFTGAIASYGEMSKAYPDFSYQHPSVKPSLFSYIGNYMGYTGYYNPFTGEAQVNTTVPLFIQPFTTCHEIGHQLGYARENEANFSGFLAARFSPDPAFRYSVYFDLYSYGRFYLYIQDSMSMKKIDSSLHTGIRADYKNLRAFLHRYRNPAGEAIDRLYAQYLRANEQPEGRITYNQVVLWVLAYYRKYGEKAL